MEQENEDIDSVLKSLETESEALKAIMDGEEDDKLKPLKKNAPIVKSQQDAVEPRDGAQKEESIPEIPDNPSPEETESPQENSDAHFELRLSDDKVTLFINAYPAKGNGAKLSRASLLTSLERLHIDKPIPGSNIEKLIKTVNIDKTPLEDFILVEGRAAIPGVEPEILDKANFKLPVEPDKKKVFKGEITPCTDDEVLLTIVAPAPGTEGKNLLGDLIPVESTENPYKAGEGVKEVVLEGKIQYVSKLEDAIAEITPEGIIQAQVFKNGSYDINISEDHYHANLHLVPPQGRGLFVELTELLAAFKEKNISFGLQEKTLQDQYELYRDERLEVEFEFATGIEPIHGKNASLDFKVDVEISEKFEENARGQINFKERKNVLTVSKGTVLAHSTLPTKSERSGKTIFGELKSAEDGIKIDVELGSGVEKKPLEDGCEAFLASIDGELTVNQEPFKIEVNPSITVDQVNLEFGNLLFDGNATVEGNIDDGMEVDVKGNLYVKGNILGAKVQVGGDLVCENGIVTKENGYIHCKGEMAAKFIENSNIRCSESIMVERAIMNSNIHSESHIEVLGEKAQILGSKLQAKYGLRARDVGNSSGAKNTIEVGTDHSLHDEYNAKILLMQKSKKTIERIDLAIRKLFQVKPKVELFNNQMKMLYKEYLTQKKSLILQMQKDRERALQISENIDLKEDSYIEIHGFLYPDNILVLGRNKLKIEKKEAMTCFFMEGGSKEIQKKNIAPTA